MAKLIKVYDANDEKDILINIDNISLITDNYIYLNNNSKLHSVINTNQESIHKVYEACGYHETPFEKIERETGRKMGLYDLFGYSNDGYKWSSPRKYSPEEDMDPDLVIGGCKCSSPPYGHVFKKADFPSGEVKYKCICCGLESTLIFNSNSTESEDK